MSYRRDIDGLRAVAVLSVIFFHYGMFGVSGGFTGVDVFFVISGYVIAGSLQRDLENGHFSITEFYFKRIRRILPALVVTLLITSIFSVVFLLPDDLGDFSQSLISAASFWSNVYFWRNSGYFGISEQLRPLLHTWSLCVEEQFYVFMPILMWAIYTRLKKRWLLVCLPLLGASFVLSVVAASAAPTANFFLLPTRIWELLIGAVLLLNPPPVLKGRGSVELVSVVGAVLLIVGLFHLDENDPFPGYNALFPCVGAALIIYAGSGKHRSTLTRMLASKPAVGIGLISYSLYLVHWPVSVFVRYESFSPPTLLQGAAMLGLSFALAGLMWRYVESPFRRPEARWLTFRLAFSGAGVSLAGLVLIGYIGTFNGGFPGRFPDYTEVSIPSTEEWKVGSCFNDGTDPLENWKLADCTRTHGFSENALLWGDSFAAHYAPGLESNRDKLNANVIEYTFADCPPVLKYRSFARPNCTTFNQNALSVIEASNVTTVILGGRWAHYERLGFQDLKDTIDVLRHLGKKVVLIGQSPEFPADIKKIAYFATHHGHSEPTWPESINPAVNDRLAHLSSDLTFVDPLAGFCQGEICQYRDRDSFFFADYGHFSVAGSKVAIFRTWPRLH